MDLWRNKEFSICTNNEYLNLDIIHRYLSEEAYWSKGIPMENIIKSIANSSLCFGVYKGEVGTEGCAQVGFARVISDFSSFAYLCDVFILPDFQKLGLAKWLLDIVNNHPELTNVRRFMLATKDAHSLYTKYGFEHINNPEFFMQKVRKPSYQQ
ncbi:MULTISPECIES: GNAT family N-acetyltransferase [Bacillaceae]|uniref:GNAT family N-acetyltransferase n=1 Tax=Bacillaceae TaxID=186817 RepID=UPI001BDEAD3A|nr:MULTISPECIES: GNAT family N-acetyltransferase [Bacillaceae]MDX8360737.1 GNAT family N-acetyltransferase [Cytobacillus sp. IB215316]